MFAQLKSRNLLHAAGPEAEAFLERLLSNRAPGSDGSAHAAALLSPQGKVQFDLIIVREPGGFLLDCEAARADELLAKLNLYRLRAKIGLAVEPALAVFARYRPPFASSDLSLRNVRVFTDPRLPSLGERLIGGAESIHRALASAGLSESTEAQYAADRRLAGVAEGAGELGVEKIFLLEANAEELNAVDFQKGCYVGQELTSRMKRKAELKKRLLPLRVAGEAAPGEQVSAAGDLLGSVIGGGPGIAFALLRLDRLAEARAKDAPILIGERPAHLHIPPFLAGRL